MLYFNHVFIVQCLLKVYQLDILCGPVSPNQTMSRGRVSPQGPVACACQGLPPSLRTVRGQRGHRETPGRHVYRRATHVGTAPQTCHGRRDECSAGRGSGGESGGRCLPSDPLAKFWHSGTPGPCGTSSGFRVYCVMRMYDVRLFHVCRRQSRLSALSVID